MGNITLFCVRPTTRNIGNDLIYHATCELVRSVLGADTAIVSVPAVRDARHGGLTAGQVYDINRLADGVIVGGGNLLENGQLTIEPQALAALRVPLMVLGVSHGRIHDCSGDLCDRTDSLAPDAIRLLCGRASATLVRDRATVQLLQAAGVSGVQLGGCPSLFMTAPRNPTAGRRVLISIRHPGRMSVPPELQWRTVADVRGLIDALEAAYGKEVHLLCHDYNDLEFARGFPGTPRLYFDDVARYIEALRAARLTVTYRLHAFLPCLAMGTPSIHLSYDERGRAMVATAGMGEWDIDLMKVPDVVSAVMRRTQELGCYRTLRTTAQATIAGLRATCEAALHRFAAEVGAAKTPHGT